MTYSKRKEAFEKATTPQGTLGAKETPVATTPKFQRFKRSVPHGALSKGHEVENTVTFKPEIGSDYENCGRAYLGKRIMIIGASHYCEHFRWEKGCGQNCAYYGKYHLKVIGRELPLHFGSCCERFTEIVYERYRNWLKVPDKGKNRWMGTLTRFYNAFFVEGNPTDEARNRLLKYLVCTEYVQGSEAKEWKEHNDTLMTAQRNFDELSRQVRRLKPDVIIVWGPRVWQEICKRTGVDSRKESAKAVLGGRQVELLNTPHPSASVKRTEFQRRLRSVGIALLPKCN